MYKKLLQHILTLKSGTKVTAASLAAQCEGAKLGRDLQCALRALVSDKHLRRADALAQYEVV